MRCLQHRAQCGGKVADTMAAGGRLGVGGGGGRMLRGSSEVFVQVSKIGALPIIIHLPLRARVVDAWRSRSDRLGTGRSG